MSEKESFGDFIRKARKARCMTLRDLEAATKLSAGYLSDLETGKHNNPTVTAFITVCDALGLDKAGSLRYFTCKVR